MLIGKMRHKITIQQPPTVPNAYNEAVGDWTDVATIFAWIAPAGGREGAVAREMQAETDHIVKIRYLSGVSPKMRIWFGARKFDILGVLNTEERNREMTLLCVERS